MGADYPDIIADSGTANAPPSITIRGGGGVTTTVTQVDPDGSAATLTITSSGGGTPGPFMEPTTATPEAIVLWLIAKGDMEAS